ncbi:pilus assembly protein, PilP [Mariprofundus micogutta]|uniref:Pilus assembly protein, PilP n=1 Tax=Mariprofundus micogutta TaxID=1921010 RepID=A0A1L8CLK1_9PROT|nr:pilus assembly protein PilP [Mariprofundus micogutta]GAV19719.1 pilus assembly protein, PilP [Mariprofundus micogutta]
MRHLIWLISTMMIGVPLASAAPASDSSEDIPDAMQHMVTAPVIDFANLRDPFASYLESVARRGRTALIENQLRLTNRSREKLEDYDLSTLSLVAIFSMGGERVAMVQDSTAKGFIVRRGNYLGKNNGKIEKITDDTVFLVEQVLNPAGEITDRQVSLTMKEVND